MEHCEAWTTAIKQRNHKKAEARQIGQFHDSKQSQLLQLKKRWFPCQAPHRKHTAKRCNQHAEANRNISTKMSIKMHKVYKWAQHCSISVVHFLCIQIHILVFYVLASLDMVLKLRPGMRWRKWRASSITCSSTRIPHLSSATVWFRDLWPPILRGPTSKMWQMPSRLVCMEGTCATQECTI